jgi:hypothetical protein
MWHHLQLRVEGTRATAYIDGESVLSYDGFGRYAWGRMGLKIINGGVIQFDNVVVEDLKPIAHWKFDEGEGSIAYDSAGNNDGTLTNGPTWTASGINGSLIFDGADDYVEIANDEVFDIADKLSLSAWIRPNGFDSRILSKWRSGNLAYILGLLPDGELFFAFSSDCSWDSGGNGPDGWQVNSIQTVDIGTWSHCAAVHDESTIRVYVNGDETIRTSVSASICTAGSEGVKIGIDGDGYGPFNGLIDEVRIYDRALSAEDVRQLYREGLGGKAYWPEPEDGQEYVDPDTVLGWQPGDGAVSHDVYLGTNSNDVNDADTLSPEFMDNVDVTAFDPCGLELITTYYWRIDEVNGPNTVKGDVWTFTTWLEPNLVAWWKLDEGEGLTACDSAGNNDGTLTNGPIWTPSGIDGSLIFDGVDDHVSVPNDSSLNPTSQIAISVWVKPTDWTAGHRRIIQKRVLLMTSIVFMHWANPWIWT